MHAIEAVMAAWQGRQRQSRQSSACGHASCLMRGSDFAHHQMYIMPRLSLLLASSIKRCAWPSTLSGMQGWLDTPSSVPFSRPVGQQCQGRGTRVHQCT